LCVIFEYELPSKRERIQLLEKIEFIVTKRFNQCKGNYTRSSNQPRRTTKTNKYLEELKCFENMKMTICFEEIIALLKAAYSYKPKSSKERDNSLKHEDSQDNHLAESGFSPGIRETDIDKLGYSMEDSKQED
jgi:hypothetical protein